MDTTFNIEALIRNGRIENELDLQKALIAHRKLRILSKDDEHFKHLWEKLTDAIEEYEKLHWSGDKIIDEAQIKESDLAEIQAEKERVFLERRKKLIREKLKKLQLNQQEFGLILGHSSKTYMSELMNGLCPFSLRDLTIINQLLKIDMNDLVPVFLSETDRNRVEATLTKLKNKQLAFG